MGSSPYHAIIIGIGNPDRGDDGAGRAVARWLQGRVPPEVRIVEDDGEPASLLGHLAHAGMAWLIDACASGVPAGTVRRFDVDAAPLPADASNMSTHGLGLAQAIELARALDQLPERCVVYVIEGESFQHGAGLSQPVATAISEVGGQVMNEITIDAGVADA